MCDGRAGTVDDISCRNLLVHHELTDVPECFRCRYIACIKVELDLILTFPKLHGGTIMAFVDILVDVLDGLE
jgi:hypothetical protein